MEIKKGLFYTFSIIYIAMAILTIPNLFSAATWFGIGTNFIPLSFLFLSITLFLFGKGKLVKNNFINVVFVLSICSAVILLFISLTSWIRFPIGVGLMYLLVFFIYPLAYILLYFSVIISLFSIFKGKKSNSVFIVMIFIFVVSLIVGLALFNNAISYYENDDSIRAVTSGGDPALCEQIKDKSQKNECYHAAGYTTGDISYCKKIILGNIYNNIDLKDSCFFFAIQKKGDRDIALCDLISYVPYSEQCKSWARGEF